MPKFYNGSGAADLFIEKISKYIVYLLLKIVFEQNIETCFTQ